jgi:hypothetical protein
MSRPTHQWDTSSVKHMKIEEESGHASLSNAIPILDALETERFVESLCKFDLTQVGSVAWMEQHRKFEKLNIQAHQNAMSNSDEYVLEAFLTFNKLEVLIYDLLLIEAWKENVYPLLLDKLAGRNSMRIYFILYHEATIINLLEVFLFYRHVCEAGGEKMLEVVDYIGRKLVRLNNTSYDFRLHDISSERASNTLTAESAKQYADDLSSRSPVDELKSHFLEIEFRICISAVAIARFLSEHADAMPLSVISRITDIHDYLILCIPLIENPPWTRRLDSGKWQKLVDHKWQEVKPIDLLKITKCEGQPWLAVYFLLAKEVFRERYHLNSFRKGQLLRVRKYINEMLLDQLPFLADIQRYMDELSITEVPEPSSLSGNVFLFQQVAVIRESITKGRSYPEVAAKQLETVFTMTDKTDLDLLEMANLYSDDLSEL